MAGRCSHSKVWMRQLPNKPAARQGRFHLCFMLDALGLPCLSTNVNPMPPIAPVPGPAFEISNFQFAPLPAQSAAPKLKSRRDDMTIAPGKRGASPARASPARTRAPPRVNTPQEYFPSPREERAGRGGCKLTPATRSLKLKHAKDEPACCRQGRDRPSVGSRTPLARPA